MIQLIYASAASDDFTDDDLADLLHKARTNNQAQELTGMLIYQDGTFLQVLEGDEDAVKKLYVKIAADPRHCGLRKLLRTEIEERSFGEWKMGFHNATGQKLEAFPGFTDFFRSNAPFGNEEIDRARKVLLQFREGLWRQREPAAAG